MDLLAGIVMVSTSGGQDNCECVQMHSKHKATLGGCSSTIGQQRVTTHRLNLRISITSSQKLHLPTVQHGGKIDPEGFTIPEICLISEKLITHIRPTFKIYQHIVCDTRILPKFSTVKSLKNY